MSCLLPFALPLPCVPLVLDLTHAHALTHSPETVRLSVTVRVTYSKHSIVCTRRMAYPVSEQASASSSYLFHHFFLLSFFTLFLCP